MRSPAPLPVGGDQPGWGPPQGSDPYGVRPDRHQSMSPESRPVAVVDAVVVSSTGACLWPAEIVMAIGYRVLGGGGGLDGGAK
jgi:hypothetical protein